MPISSTDQLTFLYKKYFGVANAKGVSTSTSLEYPISARQKVIPSLQLYKNAVPATAPLSGNYTEDTAFTTANSGLTIATGYAPKRYVHSTYPHIVKYENIPLISPPGFVNALRSSTALKDSSGNILSGDSQNILINSIPTNLDPLGSYKITLTNVGASPSPIEVASDNNQYPWIIDNDAGIVTFYKDTAGTQTWDFRNDSTKRFVVTFYRYEGELGQNDITVANGGAGRVVTTVDAAGNMTANPSVVFDSASSTLDLSNNSLKLKNVLLAAAGGSSDFTIKFPAAGPTVDGSGTVYNLALDQSGNIVYRNANTAESKFIDAAQFSLISDLTQRLDDVSGSATTERLIGLSDSYTSAIAKLDNWLYRNIVSAPPSIDAITPSANVINTSSDITIWWYYPTQFNVGITDSYLPAINSFSAKVQVGSGGAITTICDPTSINKTALASGAGKTFIGPAIGTSMPYRAIRFSKLESTGFTTKTIVINGVSTANVPTYVYKTNSLTFNSTTNILSLYYANNNTTDTAATTVTFSDYATAGVPGQPTIFSVSSTSDGNNNVTGISITLDAANLVDINNPNSSDYLTSIDVSGIITSNAAGLTLSGFSYQNNLPANTHLGSARITFTIPTSAPIYPGTTYSIKVATKNSQNASYSAYSAASNVTTTTPNAASISSIALTRGSGFYTDTLNKVADNQSVSNVFNNNNTSLTYTFAPAFGAYNPKGASTLMIHSIDRASSTAAALAKLTADVGGTNVVASYDGFPAKSYTATGTNIQIAGTSSVDYYGSDTGYTGYYLKLNSNPNITLSGTTISASSAQRTLTLTYDVSGGTQRSTTANYYADDTTGNPNIAAPVITIRDISSVKVTGVDTVYAAKIDIVTDISNIGHYFYKSPFLAYATGTGTAVSAASETTLTNVTAGKSGDQLLGKITVTRNGANALSLTPANAYTNGINVAATVTGITGTPQNSTSNALSYLTDYKSYNLINTAAKYPVSINTITTSAAAGRHIQIPAAVTTVVNGASATFTPLTTAYDNNESLLTNNRYLQIADGLFTAKSGLNTSYKSYTDTRNSGLNYSTISGMRYAAFVWQISAGTSYGTDITIRFKNINTSAISIGNDPAGYINKDAANSFAVYYRVVDGSSPTPTSASSPSIVWTNGNTTNGFNASTNVVSSNSGTIGGVKASSPPSISGSDLIITVQTNSGIATASTYLNVIVGLGIDGNGIQFESIQANMSASA
jgi:hypothetical protein